MGVSHLLCILSLVLLGKGLEAVDNNAGVVAVVDVDTGCSHPCLKQSYF